ncbi:MAG: diphthamide synthesis protein [Candidatus Pacearchaeota archaeon]|jgi:2-(3-amino-3-carboxypropyl)histidine synthase
MQIKTIEEINEIYDLELDKIVKTIKKNKAKRVLLQFPEGIKPYSTVVVDYLSGLKELKNIEFFIWLGTCFGACDVPLEVERLGVDLIVQFGHSAWKFGDKKIKII